MDANLPNFHWFQLSSHSRRISQTCLSSSSSRSVCAVSLLAGGSMSKMPRPGSICASFARSDATCASYSEMSSTARPAEKPSAKGPFRSKSCRSDSVCALKSLSDWSSSSLKSPLALSSRRSASTSPSLKDAQSAESDSSFASSSSLTVTSMRSSSLYLRAGGCGRGGPARGARGGGGQG